MKTVGEILKTARQAQKITVEQAEKDLRIRKKHLLALEENEWSYLPSLPYIKGFLQNYSTYLGLKPNEVLAFFRRQWNKQEKAGLVPESMTDPVTDRVFRLTPQRTILLVTVAFLAAFFGYLLLQYVASTNPPKLTIDVPREGEVVENTEIVVSGKTDPDAVLSVNGQTIALSKEGEFSTRLSLTPGVNTIVVEAVSKIGRKTTQQRTIQIEKQE